MSKTVTIQYPDSSIHTINVKLFAKSTSTGKYFIEYYDIETNTKQYTTLTKNNGTYYNEPSSGIPHIELISHHVAMSTSLLPDYIKCLSLTPQTQTQRQFIVYQDEDNMYIGEYVAEKYSIPNRDKKITVDGVVYTKILPYEIHDIINKSNHTEIPFYKQYAKKEAEIEITPKETKLSEIIIHRVMTYYKDINNNQLYVDRNGYELSKTVDIEIEGTPSIIDDRNCYSITQEQLNSLMEKTNDHCTWVPKSIISENKSIEAEENYKIDEDDNNYRNLEINRCELNGKIFIPEKAYTEFKEKTNQKRIRVAGILYINVTEEEMEYLKAEYKKIGIKIIFKDIIIAPNKKTNESKRDPEAAKKALDSMFTTYKNPDEDGPYKK